MIIHALCEVWEARMRFDLSLQRVYVCALNMRVRVLSFVRLHLRLSPRAPWKAAAALGKENPGALTFFSSTLGSRSRMLPGPPVSWFWELLSTTGGNCFNVYVYINIIQNGIIFGELHDVFLLPLRVNWISNWTTGIVDRKVRPAAFWMQNTFYFGWDKVVVGYWLRSNFFIIILL